MIFGDKNTFATEVKILEKSDGKQFLDCHFSYWIGNVQIGNFECDAPVCELEVDLRNILREKDSRTNSVLFGKTDSEIVKLVRNGISENKSYSPHASKGYWTAHDITYNMGHGYKPEFVNYWDVYIVENDISAKILYTLANEGENIENISIPKGMVDKSLFNSWEYLIDALD